MINLLFSQDEIMSFAHFTYHSTKGTFMILDLQGVYYEDSKSYVLSDPAIISNSPVGGLYGPTDLGLTAIKEFFERHKCNEICVNFSKPNMDEL